MYATAYALLNKILLSSLLFIQLNAQIDCSKEMLKLTLKVFLPVLVIQPSSGSLLFVQSTNSKLPDDGHVTKTCRSILM